MFGFNHCAKIPTPNEFKLILTFLFKLQILQSHGITTDRTRLCLHLQRTKCQGKNDLIIFISFYIVFLKCKTALKQPKSRQDLFNILRIIKPAKIKCLLEMLPHSFNELFAYFAGSQD